MYIFAEYYQLCSKRLFKEFAGGKIIKFSQGHNFLEKDGIQYWGKKEGRKKPAESVSSDFSSASIVSAITTVATYNY